MFPDQEKEERIITLIIFHFFSLPFVPGIREILKVRLGKDEQIISLRIKAQVKDMLN
jgi:hypothetical protein